VGQHCSDYGCMGTWSKPEDCCTARVRKRWPVADARVAGTSVCNLIKFRHQ
jgi:hypothetical protein